MKPAISEALAISDALRTAIESLCGNPGNLRQARELARQFAFCITERNLDELEAARPFFHDAQDDLANRSLRDASARLGEGVFVGLSEVCDFFLRITLRDVAQEKIDLCLSKKLNYAILQQLSQGVMLPSELADRLAADSGQISRNLRELRLAGLIAESPQAKGGTDNRSKPYKITLTGMQAVAPPVDEDAKQTKEDLEILRRFFTRLIEIDTVQLLSDEHQVFLRRLPAYRDRLGRTLRKRTDGVVAGDSKDFLTILDQLPPDLPKPLVDELRRWKPDSDLIRDLIKTCSSVGPMGSISLDDNQYELLKRLEPMGSVLISSIIQSGVKSIPVKELVDQLTSIPDNQPPGPIAAVLRRWMQENRPSRPSSGEPVGRPRRQTLQDVPDVDKVCAS